MSVTCTITDVLCILPSTGTFNSDYRTAAKVAIAGVGGVVGLGMGTAGAGSATVGSLGLATAAMAIFPPAGSVVGDAASGGLAELGTRLVDHVGQTVADDLYLEVDDEKVWPSDAKSYDINAGQRVDIGYTFDVPRIKRISLRERDVVLIDDHLFEFEVSPSSNSAIFAQTEPTPKNGCMYAISIVIAR